MISTIEQILLFIKNKSIVLAIVCFLLIIAIIYYWSNLPKDKQSEDKEGWPMWLAVFLFPIALCFISIYVFNSILLMLF